MERSSVHRRFAEDTHVDRCIRLRLGRHHAESDGYVRLVQHDTGSHRLEGIQGRSQCDQSVPLARHRTPSPRGQYGVLPLPEEVGRSRSEIKQSHAIIMGILPSDERVHHSTLRAHQIKSGGRVEPSTNHIDRGISGPTQHGNHLEEIFVDAFGNRLDGECGEQAMSKIHFRIPSTRGVRVKVLPWVVVGAGGLGAGKTSGAGTRGVFLDVVIGGRTGDTDTNGGESSDNRSKVHADCGPAENPSL